MVRAGYHNNRVEIPVFNKQKIMSNEKLSNEAVSMNGRVSLRLQITVGVLPFVAEIKTKVKYEKYS